MKMFETADRYCKESSWKTLALLKFCLFAMGMLIGMRVPEKHKKAAGAVCGGIFVLTYVPLMKKFFDVCREEKEIEGEAWL